MDNQEKNPKPQQAVDAERVKSIDRACAAAIAFLRPTPVNQTAGKPHKRRNKRSR